jgi:hypothetical protein
VVYRYVGYGKRSIQQRMVDFKAFWIMFSTKPVQYYAMNVSLDMVM